MPDEKTPGEETKPQLPKEPLPKPKPVERPLRFETFSEGYDPSSSKVKTLNEKKEKK